MVLSLVNCILDHIVQGVADSRGLTFEEVAAAMEEGFQPFPQSYGLLSVGVGCLGAECFGVLLLLFSASFRPIAGQRGCGTEAY